VLFVISILALPLLMALGWQLGKLQEPLDEYNQPPLARTPKTPPPPTPPID